MKLLDNPIFDSLNSDLSHAGTTCMLDARLESYSCKMVQHDKHVFKSLIQNHDPDELQALSPPQPLFLMPEGNSPVNRLSGEESIGSLDVDRISRRTLYYLTATLNISFGPDYDFTGAKSKEFSKEPEIRLVMHNVDTRLLASIGNEYNAMKQEMWKMINDEVSLNDCEIYSYNPESDCDPFSEPGCLWSFNYFFYNKKMKEIVFFMCRGRSCSSVADEQQKYGQLMMSDFAMESDEEEYY